ncbi:MAG: hypothetical protein R3179_07210 [Sedimenticolaceae bacterium]|nr:hypothetical protein [Sedimenticolaceae bacterium]
MMARLAFIIDLVVMAMRHILILILLSLTPGLAAEWQPLPATQQGYELRYDPQTSRVETRVNGQVRPMWDGVHRLENGQVLRIHNGVAVRDETVMQSEPRPQSLRDEVSTCRRLVRRSCGLGGTCAHTESCRHASQLLTFHNEAKSSDRHKIELQCLEALDDTAFFKPCPVPTGKGRGSACFDLVVKSCGTLGQCKETEGCDLARQLQQMEYDEKLMLIDTRQKTPTTQQCEEVFSDDEVFVPCLK